MTRADADNRITFFGTTDFRNQHRRFGIRKSDRRFHTYIIGRSGSGKSSLLHTLIRQDMENGEGLLLLDPHGDLVTQVLATVPRHRATDVIYFNPFKTTLGFNPLERVPALFQPLATAGLISAFKTIWAD